MGVQKQGDTTTLLLSPADHADTAAATGAWTAISDAVGDVKVEVIIGVVTAGTVTPKVQTATDDQGAGVADVTPLVDGFSAAGTASDEVVQVSYYNAKQFTGYVRVVGTIATGPAVVGAVMTHTPNQAS